MDVHNLKFGKLPAQPGAIKFKLGNYVDRSQLPKAPARFGHAKDLKVPWGMLGNDRAGNCTMAGAAHEEMIWAASSKKPIPRFTAESVIAEYSKLSGFDPRTGANDTGLYVRDVANHRRNVGLVDADGNVHKVAAYVDIDPGSIEDLYIGIYLFGAVGIGFEVPSYAMDQIRNNEVWETRSGGSIVGGHYVPLVTKYNYINCVTWGKLQAITPAFYQKYNDESVCYVSSSALTDRKSPEGFDYDQLVADLNALRAA